MKKIIKKYGWGFLSIILLASCSTVEEDPSNPISGIDSQKKQPRFILKKPIEKPESTSVVRTHGKFDPKKTKKDLPKKMYLVLECVSSLRQFKAGKPAKMTFRMRNFEFKPVFIKGWMIKESNNINLFYIPWKEKMKRPPEDQWYSLKPNIGKNPETMTLELAPRNSVLLDLELPFVEEIKTSETKHFVIYAQIRVDYVIKNQVKVNTFVLNSKYIKITVKP